jgi:hypothetical protein
VTLFCKYGSEPSACNQSTQFLRKIVSKYVSYVRIGFLYITVGFHKIFEGNF